MSPSGSVGAGAAREVEATSAGSGQLMEVAGGLYEKDKVGVDG